MKKGNLLSGILLLCLLPFTSNAEIPIDWEGVRSNSEEKIDDWRGGYIPEGDSIKNYIQRNKNYDSEYVLVPRQIDKPWNQSSQVLPYAKKYVETIKNDTETANILADIYTKVTENPKYKIEDANEKEVLKLIIDRISDAKEQKSILKDYEKGNVSKKLLPLIEKYYDQCVNNVKKCKSDYEKLKKDPVNFIATKFKKKVTLDKKTVYDTVPNPFYRDKAFRNYYFMDAMWEDLIGDWDWVYTEDGEYVKQQYPCYATYIKYDSHPGIRVTGDNIYSESNKHALNVAFDDNGNLVRIIKSGAPAFKGIDFRVVSRHDHSGIGRQIARWAYEDNKYDIKSQPKKVQDYITDQLGLRQKTKAEKAKSDKATTAMANAMVDYMKADSRHGKNTKKSNRAKDKAAEEFLGALLGGSSDYYSSEGASWLQQIEEDNRPYFQNIYKLERIDDTTFRGILVDKNLKPVYELIFEYTTGERPYSVKENIKINRFSNGEDYSD